MTNGPTPQQASQFALILSSGAPAREAIRYFLPEDSPDHTSPAAVEALAERWMRSKEVETAISRLQGKTWESMSSSEKIEHAISKHYVEMAYFLYTRNYVDLDGPSKAKADTCRSALEAKLAGMSGKLTALEQFWSDVSSGKIRLSQTSSPGGGVGGPTAQTHPGTGHRTGGAHPDSLGHAGSSDLTHLDPPTH